MTARTVAGVVSLALAVVALVALVYVVSGRGWREQQEQRAMEAEATRAAHRARIEARVEECRSKGGVPITDGWSGVLVRCDFPRCPAPGQQP